MKFLCLGYYDEKKFDALPKPELDALVRECQAHDEALRRSGHLILVASLAPHAHDARACVHAMASPRSPTVLTPRRRSRSGPFSSSRRRPRRSRPRVASQHPAAHLGEHVGGASRCGPSIISCRP